VAGTATAGIPHAAWVAERLGLPMVYVRSSAKEHGRRRRVEGVPLDGEAVVLIEDLVSFGGSAASAVEALREERAKVIGVQAIMSYGFEEAEQRLAEVGAPLQALVDYEDLLAVAPLDDVSRRALRDWRGR